MWQWLLRRLFLRRRLLCLGLLRSLQLVRRFVRLLLPPLAPAAMVHRPVPLRLLVRSLLRRALLGWLLR
jgi:hypothetical protein